MGAEKGDADAQYFLGWAYYKGFGIKADAKQSLYWLTKAANNGSARAMDKLGTIYSNGLLDQKVDKVAARQWSQKAINTRKKTGETDPAVDRRLRFFGVDVDNLK